MRIQAAVRGQAASGRSRRFNASVRKHLAPIVAMAAVGGAIAGFFLALYVVKGYSMPIGWDTARYLDETNLVVEHGLSGVDDVQIPRPSRTLGSRVGFPITVLSTSKLFRTSTFGPATVVPIAAIVGTSLAAGAFVSYAFRRGVLDALVVAAVVGTSTAMVRLIAGTYTDNLLAASVLVAALIPVASAAGGRRGLAAAVALLSAAGLVHPVFFGFVLVVLVLVAAAYAPGSLRAWRGGEQGPWDTPTGRLGVIVGGSGALAAVGIYGLLRSTVSSPEGLLSRMGNARKLREDLGLYRLPYMLPVASVGMAATAARAQAVSRREEHRPGVSRPFAARFGLIVMVAWTGVAAVGIAGFYAGGNLPAHRFLAFFVPLPILVGVGLLTLGRLVDRRAGRIAAAIVVMAGLAGAGYLGYANLYGTLVDRGVAWIDRAKVGAAATAQRYLDEAHVPPDRPVVYVIDDRGPNPQAYIPELAHIMRTVMPAARIEHAFYYVGTAENYLAGRPTILPEDTRRYNVVSGRFWDDLQPALRGRPVALVVRWLNPGFDRYADAHPDRLVAPTVAILNGPQVATPLGPVPVPSAPRGIRLAGFSILALVMFALIGAGWAVALLPGDVRPFEILAVAIGFGVGFLVIAGTIVETAGFRFGGPAGAATPVMTALLGWLLGALRIRRDRGVQTP